MTQAENNSLRNKLQERLGFYVSFTTAIIAALAALSSLLMARHGGKSTSELVLASNSWSYYQAQSLKTYILSSEDHLLQAMGKTIPGQNAAKMEEKEQEKQKAKTAAESHSLCSRQQGALAGILGNAVTLFQIAIANAAIAALSKRPAFWLISILLALAGVGFLISYAMQPAPILVPM